jgi:hypothetical protein
MGDSRLSNSMEGLHHAHSFSGHGAHHPMAGSRGSNLSHLQQQQQQPPQHVLEELLRQQHQQLHPNARFSPPKH